MLVRLNLELVMFVLIVIWCRLKGVRFNIDVLNINLYFFLRIWGNGGVFKNELCMEIFY